MIRVTKIASSIYQWTVQIHGKAFTGLEPTFAAAQEAAERCVKEQKR